MDWFEWVDYVFDYKDLVSKREWTDKRWSTYYNAFFESRGGPNEDRISKGVWLGDTPLWDVTWKIRLVQILLYWYAGIFIHPSRRKAVVFPDSSWISEDPEIGHLPRHKWGANWEKNYASAHWYLHLLTTEWDQFAVSYRI